MGTVAEPGQDPDPPDPDPVPDQPIAIAIVESEGRHPSPGPAVDLEIGRVDGGTMMNEVKAGPVEMTDRVASKAQKKENAQDTPKPLLIGRNEPGVLMIKVRLVKEENVLNTRQRQILGHGEPGVLRRKAPSKGNAHVTLRLRNIRGRVQMVNKNAIGVLPVQ